MLIEKSVVVAFIGLKLSHLKAKFSPLAKLQPRFIYVGLLFVFNMSVFMRYDTYIYTRFAEHENKKSNYKQTLNVRQ